MNPLPSTFAVMVINQSDTWDSNRMAHDKFSKYSNHMLITDFQILNPHRLLCLYNINSPVPASPVPNMYFTIPKTLPTTPTSTSTKGHRSLLIKSKQQKQPNNLNAYPNAHPPPPLPLPPHRPSHLTRTPRRKHKHNRKLHPLSPPRAPNIHHLLPRHARLSACLWVSQLRGWGGGEFTGCCDGVSSLPS